MSDDAYQRRRRPAIVRLPVCGIHVLESHHAKTFQMQMGCWPFDKLCWIPVGRGFLELPEASTPIHQDDLLLLPAGVRHRFVDDRADPLTLVIACFQKEAMGAGKDFNKLLRRVAVLYPPGRSFRSISSQNRTQIADSFRRMLREQAAGKPGCEVVVQAELALVLVDIVRGCTDSPLVAQGSEQAITEALEYLEEYYYKPIQLDIMAARYGLSSRRFSELFKIRTGQTLIEYVNAKRVKSAQERLKATGHIAYACLEAGFNDVGYFYRVFKKHTGQTPGEYLQDT